MFTITYDGHSVEIPRDVEAQGPAAVEAYAAKEFMAAGINWPPPPAPAVTGPAEEPDEGDE